MCKFIMKCAPSAILIILLSVLVKINGKKTSIYNSRENDILEKSEITVKFPLYALKMPPIITSRKRTNSKVEPIPVSCSSSNVTRSLNDLRKQIRCVPRDIVIEVSTQDGSKIVPNVVVVKRCGGLCAGGKKCISIKKQNAEFYVRTTQTNNKLVFCNRINIPEDTECKCDCPEKKRCSINQKYDPNLCKCVCTNKEEERECLDRTNENFKWIAKTCSCGCKKTKPCTTGAQWFSKECRCVKL